VVAGGGCRREKEYAAEERKGEEEGKRLFIFYGNLLIDALVL
jgi:hypothetical protein